jgi:hypothetical protein
MMVEIKKDDLDLGIAYNILQILAARQQNVRNGVNMGDAMYGLVSTGFRSILPWVVFDENGSYELTRSNDIDFSMDNPDELRGQIVSLAGKIMWIING